MQTAPVLLPSTRWSAIFGSVGPAAVVAKEYCTGKETSSRRIRAIATIRYAQRSIARPQPASQDCTPPCQDCTPPFSELTRFSGWWVGGLIFGADSVHADSRQ
jgi:hypothetical protein